MTAMMTRRSFLKASMAGATTMLLPALKAASATSAAGRPNVVMIIVDDMNDYGFLRYVPGDQDAVFAEVHADGGDVRQGLLCRSGLHALAGRRLQRSVSA